MSWGLVGGVAGAIIGAPFGLSAVGWAVGSTIGGIVDAATAPGTTVEGPRVDDKRVTTSTYGEPITRLWGKGRMAGQLIWSTGLVEQRHERDVGGKGFGAPKQTQVSYSYSESFAIAFCRGPIKGFGRVWCDGKLYTNLAAGQNTVAASQYAEAFARGTGIAFIALTIARAAGAVTHSTIQGYLGTESQNADPLMESYLGAGNVPGYRGLAYLVFEDMPLEDFGNRRPNIEVEVFAGGTEGSAEDIEPFYQSNSISGMPTSGACGTYVDGIVVWEGGPTGGIATDLDGNSWWPVGPQRAYPAELPDPNYSDWFPQGRLGQYEIFVQHPTSNFSNYDQYVYLLWAFGSDTPIPSYDESGAPQTQSVGGVQRVLEVASSGWRGCCVANNNRLYVYRLDDTLAVYDQNLNKIFDGGYGQSFASTIGYAYQGNPGLMVVEPSEAYCWTFSGSTARLYSINDDYTMTLIDSRAGHQAKSSFATGPGGIVFLRSSHQVSAYARVRGPEPAAVTLGGVVADLCEEVGLEPADIDVSELTDSLDGYVLGRPSTARGAIEPLMPAFQFDGVESDDKLKFVKRGGSSAATLAADDLSAYAGGERPPAVKITRVQELELPHTVGLSYIDKGRDYEPGYQYASRVVARGEGERTVQLPVVMSSGKARKSADVVLWDQWQQRHRYEMVTTRAFAHLDPTDVITVTDESGTTHTVRILRVDYELPNLVRLQAVEEDAAQYSSEAEGGDAEGFEASTFESQGPTFAVLMDGPMLRDVDDDAGFYAALYGPLPAWRAGALYRSKDGGASYQQAASQSDSATVATAETVLGSAPTEIFDRTSTLTVRIVSGELSSTTEALALNGANAALVGADGRWELIHFVTATDNGDDTYTLDTLLRGRRGTEHAVGSHAIGDYLVLLDAEALSRVPGDSTDLSQQRLYRAVTVGKPLSNVLPVSFLSYGIGLRPLSPVHIKGQRDGSGNLTITWIRRGRISPEWRDVVDVPLGEAEELYDMEVLDGGDVVRTLSDLTGATASYTAAEQTTDFGAAQNAIDVKVYQRSALVGRGYAGQATV